MKNKRHWSDISENMTMLLFLIVMFAFVIIGLILEKQ
jgi:hypothetical protein